VLLFSHMQIGFLELYKVRNSCCRVGKKSATTIWDEVEVLLGLLWEPDENTLGKDKKQKSPFSTPKTQKMNTKPP
jgi:hypothetical protein